MLPQEASWG